MSFIITPLRWVVDLLYSWVGSYGVAIILFTLAVKLVLLPLDIKQRHSMRKMQDIQPKIEEINKKYEKDPEKRSAKTMELYKKEKVNPMGGCLPMLIQLPILYAMFAVMRHIAGEQAVLMVQQVTQGLPFEPESFLWIRNIWQPDNIMANVIPTLSEISVNLSAVSGNDLLNTDIINVIRANYDITTWLMNGKQTAAQRNNPQAQNQKMMNYIFPLISVFFCWQYNGAFALYWVTSNIYMIITYVGFNFYADYKAKKKALEAK